jgi:RsiW-degrading membrane proteinase PrsW (M82 family)|tara:strand:+ start:407 stop:1054 length:648 start_codon:yes stop_codon:yes gene_type:complete
VIDLIISATIPPLLILLFIYRNDLYEAEPHKLLLKTFFIGFIITIPMVIIELITADIFKNILMYSVFGIALVEEGIKYLTLIYYNYPKKDFNEPYDGIIYSVVLTMGFALVENIIYVVGYDSGGDVALLRMISSIPLHATCGIVMGYFLGKSKIENKNKKQNMSLAIIIPIIIHGFYNYFIFIEIFAFSLIIVILGVVYSLKAIKIHQKNSPFKN